MEADKQRIYQIAANCASQSCLLQEMICISFFGMDLAGILFTFGGTPFIIDDFKEAISEPVQRLALIKMHLEGNYPELVLEPKFPNEFDKFDLVVQGIARRSLTKAGFDHNYRFLVAVAECLQEIFEIIQGNPELKALAVKLNRLPENQRLALEFI